MSDLVSRLSERLDELERVALAAGVDPERRSWSHGGPYCDVEAGIWRDEAGEHRWVVVRNENDADDETFPHIARWDPQAVLQLVAAHRKVIRRFQDLYERRNDGPQSEHMIRHAQAIALHAVIETLAVGFGITGEAGE